MCSDSSACESLSIIADGADLRSSLDVVASIAQKYEISSLLPLAQSARIAIETQELTIAAIGRFNAGKTSFLNAVFGREILPVGVVPVTTVITFVVHGPTERANVTFLDGAVREIALSDVRAYAAESENPVNCKRVANITIELPALKHYRGIRFVDTPGLESVLQHNTEASMRWLPNVGIALVLIGVDPPLSKRDIEVLRTIYQYTSEVVVLITKVDIVSESERRDVEAFVREQLHKQIGINPPLFQFSARPGYETLRNTIEQAVLGRAISDFSAKRAGIARTKVQSVLQECGDYLSVALKSAEAHDSDRRHLRQLVIEQRQLLEEFKTELRLIAKSAVGGTRTNIERILQAHQGDLQRTLIAELYTQFPGWATSVEHASSAFDDWLSTAIAVELTRVSNSHRIEFIGHARTLRDHLDRSLMDFRNRLSADVLRVLGVPLRTGDLAIPFEPPKTPDVRVGKIFDHNWEVFSWLIPMAVVKRAILKHLNRKIPDLVFKNLSRLTSQWDQLLNEAIMAAERLAETRAEQMISDVETMMSTTLDRASEIAADLRQLGSFHQRSEE